MYTESHGDSRTVCPNGADMSCTPLPYFEFRKDNE